MTLAEFLCHLKGVKGGNGQYSALCPYHGDRHSSLSVSVGKDMRILLYCHAGCAVEDIVWSMGLQMKDLFLEDKPEDIFTPVNTQGGSEAHFESAYIYADASGKPILKKVKMRETDGGKFYYWQQLKDGEWKKGRGSIEPPLYTNGLDREQESIFLVEGEKDVDTLKSIDIAAASLPDGAKSKWRSQYGDTLQGKAVFIIQDNDAVGSEFAQRLAGDLTGIASNIKLLDIKKVWSELPEHGDVTDLIQHQGPQRGKETIINLAKNTPAWEPTHESTNKCRPLLVKASDVPYEPPRWLIAPYFQRGKRL